MRITNKKLGTSSAKPAELSGPVKNNLVIYPGGGFRLRRWKVRAGAVQLIAH
jgi:hypothetical protein